MSANFTMWNLDVHDFGAIGDGKTNDFVAIQTAITEAQVSNKTLHFRPLTYIVRNELQISSDLIIEGHGAQIGTTNAPQRSVLAVQNQTLAEVRHLTLNASLVADHAMYCGGAGQSRFERVVFLRARKDAVLLDAKGSAGGNDCMKFERCIFQHSGQIFSEGTVSVSKGVSATITGSGTQFKENGIRSGDFIHVGEEWLQVATVDSETQITCALHPLSDGHAVGTKYTAHVGDGYREEIFNDNNLCVHRDCLYRGNAGSGARFAGLYGPRIENGQSDFNKAFGFVVGMATGSNVIGSSFHGCYTEGLGAESFFLGYAAGITIDTLNCAGEPIRTSNPSFNWGILSNVQGQMGALMPIGTEPLIHVPVAALNTHTNLPPEKPNSYTHGTILFKRAPLPGDYIGWVKLGAAPSSDWVPFGKVENPQ